MQLVVAGEWVLAVEGVVAVVEQDLADPGQWAVADSFDFAAAQTFLVEPHLVVDLAEHAAWQQAVVSFAFAVESGNQEASSFVDPVGNQTADSSQASHFLKKKTSR